MTFVLAAFLALYLWDKKAIRIIQACLLPAFIILPAFFRLKTTEGYAFYTGLIIIGAAPLAGILFKKAEPLFERMKSTPETAECPGTSEDILDNKKKWGLIKAGFAASFILVVALIAAVITLNTKVNNMYRFTTEQQSTIEEQQQQIDALKEKVEKK